MEKLEQDELPLLTHQYDGLDVYVVGGYVRDTLRSDAEPSDVDLMVTGVTRQEMLDRGFTEIDSPNNETFGVFHDSFGHEVSLAREEKSTGAGHKSFEVEPVDPDVPSDEAVYRDLVRRDLTINSMAVDMSTGEIIDPHGGISDLASRTLRAVDTDAFKQDPLRILRAARFVARLDARLNLTTVQLMMKMVDDLAHLPQERHRMEMLKALVQADEPSQFFEVLADVGALKFTFPEIDDLRDVPAGPEQYHEEGSAFRHTMMVLDEMKKIEPDDELALLMAVSHDLGKGATNSNVLPSHPGHERAGLDVAEEMATRLSMSNRQKRAMKDASRYHSHMHKINELRESTVIDFVEKCHNVDRVISLAEADAKGRTPQKEFEAGDIIRRIAAARRAISKWDGQRLIADGYDPAEMGGENFGDLLHQKRVEKMRELEGSQ